MENDFFNSICNELIGLSKNLTEYAENYTTGSLDSDGTGHYSAVYTYAGDLTPEEKKAAFIKKMNHWYFVAKKSDADSSFKITFKFGDKEIFYFTWDKDRKEFITTEPNGDEYYYDATTEMLVKIDPEKKDKEHPSGVESTTVDNTAEQKQEIVDDSNNDPIEESNSEVEFEDINEDKNFAFNLRTKLNSVPKEEDEDACDSCKILFCPMAACDDFKENIIVCEDFVTDYDEDGNAIQIRFNLLDLVPAPENVSDTDFLNDVYHNESEKLDQFCEMMKENFGFSLGSWNVKFNEDRSLVENIEFILTF